MARFTGTVTTKWSPEEAWRYLADLRSIREWDPSVADTRLVSGEPGAVGARYELDVSFLGRTVTLPYETVAAEPPSRVAFAAESEAISILDEAIIIPVLAGSKVSWNASLSLRGMRRMLELPLRISFSRLGRRAERGLRSRLAMPLSAESPVEAPR